MKKNQAMLRGSKEFRDFIHGLKFDRFKLGKDKKMLSDERITKAISRVPKLREVLMEAKIDGE